MNKEIEDKGQEKEITRCGWCGQIDREDKVYASPGDDIENLGAYHKDCFESLRIFIMLTWSDSDELLEKRIKMANKFSGNKRMEKTKKKRK
ncbi:MAG TPA: hypothetical protein VLH94_01535 [Spirochaetia bacterium]|nr:hypothetical protein [Spirochaetia bacterium]